MVDITDPGTRSRMMASIPGRDTKPEMDVRRALRRRGLFYRLQARDLPGRPDIVFRGRRICIFVHGCFWHQHGGSCPNSSMPDSAGWQAKLRANVERDRRSVAALIGSGWRVAIIWECTTRAAAKFGDRRPYDILASWITSGADPFIEI